MVLVGSLAATFCRLDKRHYNNQAKNIAMYGLRFHDHAMTALL